MSSFLSHHVPYLQFTFQVLTGSLFNWKQFTFQVLSVHFSSCADKSEYKLDNHSAFGYDFKVILV